MIYYQDDTYQPTDSKIVAHIKGEFMDVCDTELLVDPGNIDEIARAVEMFVSDELDCMCVNSDELIMLASKAMASVGDKHAARRFLLFGSGMMRPSEWEVTTEDSMWILDLKQITLGDNTALELTFFNALSLLLDAIADVWDETDGEGVLALRHVCSSASALMGNSSRTKERAFLINEIMAVCELKMGQLAVKREWSYAPRIMNLDLNA
jgi:hypothetical protein